MNHKEEDFFLGRSIDDIIDNEAEDSAKFSSQTTTRLAPPHSVKANDNIIDDAKRLDISDINRELNGAYNPTSHAISQHGKKDFTLVNEITGKSQLIVSVANNDVAITTAEDLTKARSYLGVNTDKMLTLLTVALCELNSFEHWQKYKNISDLNRVISISYSEYAKLTNMDISTTNKKKNATRTFKQSLDELASIRSTIRNKKSDHYFNFGFISSYELDASQNFIAVRLNEDFASYIMNQPRTVISPKLLQIPAHNNKYVYNTGKVLSERYYMSNNVKQGTNNRIRIANLLNLAGYPSYRTIQESYARDWKKAIIKPLERALEVLKQEPHDLLKWTGYGKGKGKVVKNKDYPNDGDASEYKIVYDDDKDADDDYNTMDIYKSYDTFTNLYLYYVLND